jgi:sterol desaturase/sphingolipid hydroxylase (fatty acid hydroxylase superfamily)
VLDSILIFACGLFAWTLVEYLIHAWLSHIFETFATPLHEEHHRDPHAVFTIGAWIPIGAIWLGGLALFGWRPAMVFFTAMVGGFVAYEAIHYRIHFCNPLSAAEASLRLRHLVHHYRMPNASFGVTSKLWDLVFGTEPLGPTMRQLCDSAATIGPLDGPSNLRKLRHFGVRRRAGFPPATQT